MQHVNKIKKYRKNSGFGLLDSLVALAIFGTVLTLYVIQTEDINISKRAKNYATNSITEAKEFAKQLQTFDLVDSQNMYGDSNRQVYKNMTYYEKYKNDLRASPNSVITLAPQNWDSKYQTTNMFGEKPCLALAYNASTDTMYGIMFYVADKEKTYKDKSKLIQRALLSLQGKGAAYVDSKIAQAVNQNRYGNNTLSPTSWSPNNLNTLVSGAKTCGGTLATNSIIINMDLLPEFNQRLIAVSGLVKSTSQNNTNQTYLPNHLFNANTLKSNLTVESGVLLDNTNQAQPIKMNIAYGAGGNTTLNVGNNQSDDTTTTFLASAIQPNTSIRSGVVCQAEELGKVAITGADSAGTNALSRSIVSCTKNATLCPTTGYCYLPSKDNLVTYQAESGFGLEDANGIFKCPIYAPYAIKSDFNSAPNVDVFVNANGITTGSILNDVKVDYGDAIHVNYTIQLGNNNQLLSRYYNCNGNCNSNGLWWYVQQINFSDSTIQHGNKLTIPQGSTEIIYDGQSDLSTPRGYKLSSTFTNCNNVCPNLDSSLGGTWGDINSIAASIIKDGRGIPTQYLNIPSNKCACARIGGDSKTWQGVTYNNLKLLGIALIENTQPHLTLITCSNSPSYNIQ